MATGESAVLGYVTLAVVVGLLLFGLSILLFLRPRGGPEVAFARLLADSRRRTNFLIGLCTSLAALFAIGLTETVALLVSAPPLEASVVLSTLFGVGAIGIFVLMTDALNTRPMTLAEEWNLRETAARMTSGPPSVPSPSEIARSGFPEDREPRRPGF